MRQPVMVIIRQDTEASKSKTKWYDYSTGQAAPMKIETGNSYADWVTYLQNTSDWHTRIPRVSSCLSF